MRDFLVHTELNTLQRYSLHWKSDCSKKCVVVPPPDRKFHFLLKKKKTQPKNRSLDILAEKVKKKSWTFPKKQMFLMKKKCFIQSEMYHQENSLDGTF